MREIHAWSTPAQAPGSPEVAAEIWRRLGLDSVTVRVPDDLAWGGPLFPRLARAGEIVGG